ncbi:hypothetical protein GH714_027303 [Hevea brasiliensis]|uniref:Retrotransposon gag domain-containing protein n=1 Tax=Hevea brasiliensis TaxID=3981 RepID=A0A6A6K754_HEVBR|nr:hypothetical protein GH714_027303 [Hevea brasiliensis]
MSWIIGSCESQIVLNLRPYKTTQTMWEYLKKLYNQTNSARRFQLECEIANYAQGSLSIQEYFSSFQNLWAEFSDIVCATVSQDSLADVLVVHKISKRDQFLMKLRSDFENAHSNLMNRHPSPTLDICFDTSAVNQNVVLTPEMVQQMIVLALSALGFKDQVSGTVIAKGPKVGRLFPLHISIPSSISLACSAIVNKSEDLGQLTYFLGLEVHSNSSGIFLHQHKYTQDLISLVGLQDSMSIDTPLELNVKYHTDEGELLYDPSLYRQIVGSLNYLTITRPDISFAVQ